MNILLAYEDDSSGDSFFSGLANDLLSFLEINEPTSLKIFTEANLTKESIETYIGSLDGADFLFVAYSHGETDRLCVDTACSTFYAKHPDNSYFFSKSTIYTFSCYSGGEFADGVITNGSNCFIGYDDKSWYDLNHINLFIRIINSGLKEILMGKECEFAVQKIKEEYDHSISNFEENDSIVRSNLSKNYRALVLK